MVYEFIDDIAERIDIKKTAPFSRSGLKNNLNIIYAISILSSRYTS